MVVQVRIPWQVPNAGPSISTFHLGSITAAGANDVSAAFREYFLDLASLLPNDVVVSNPAELEELDTPTGVLTDVFPVSTTWSVTGTGAGNWAGGAGIRALWQTGVIAYGRRVVGSTYLVPAINTAFGTGGTVASGPRNQVIVAGETLQATLGALGVTWDLVVYSRPRPGRPGAVHQVVVPGCATIAATLRGRKY